MDHRHVDLRPSVMSGVPGSPAQQVVEGLGVRDMDATLLVADPDALDILSLFLREPHHHRRRLRTKPGAVHDTSGWVQHFMP